jgi:Tol biopolymer transport system component
MAYGYGEQFAYGGGNYKGEESNSPAIDLSRSDLPFPSGNHDTNVILLLIKDKQNITLLNACNHDNKMSEHPDGNNQILFKAVALNAVEIKNRQPAFSNKLNNNNNSLIFPAGDL